MQINIDIAIVYMIKYGLGQDMMKSNVILKLSPLVKLFLGGNKTKNWVKSNMFIFTLLLC